MCSPVAFRKGKGKREDIEAEFRKHKKDFSFEHFGGRTSEIAAGQRTCAGTQESRRRTSPFWRPDFSWPIREVSRWPLYRR